MARVGAFSGTSTSPYGAITQSLDELYRVIGNSSNPGNTPTVPGPPARDQPPTSGLPVVTPPVVTPPRIDLSRPAPWVGNIIENFVNPPWAGAGLPAIKNAIGLLLNKPGGGTIQPIEPGQHPGFLHDLSKLTPPQMPDLTQLGEQVRQGLGSFEGFRKLWP